MMMDRPGCLDTNLRLTKNDKRELINLMQAKRGLLRNGHEILDAETIIQIAIKQHGNNLTCGWSGGKCSTIVLHMALKYKPDIKVLYNNTGVEFPENVKYVHQLAKEWNLNLFEVHPKTTFWKIVAENGFPKFQSHSFNHKREKWNNNKDRKPMCCFLLKEQQRFAFYKEHNITGDLCGLRAAESRTRAIHIGKMGQCYYVKLGMCYFNPIALWSSRDCEKYLADNKIPFNDTYKTQTRNGCMPCTAYMGWKKNLLAANPKMYAFVMSKRGDPLLQSFISSVLQDKKPNE